MNNCDLKTDSDQECQAACENTVGCVEFTWIDVAEFVTKSGTYMPSPPELIGGLHK